ncbi:MAG TPA: class I SAM-dependent methyltransferase [Candidatus Limnocylindrales bacterium]
MAASQRRGSPTAAAGPSADAGTAAPKSSFACLWCGRPWTTRDPNDLEGYAQLCPDCLGKAGDNPFLRFRLRAALDARARATAAGSTDAGSTDAGSTAAGSTAAAPRPEPSPEPTPAPEPAPAPEPTPVPEPSMADEMVAYYEARAPEYDDWYLRRGRYEHGPIHDAAWNAELDAAGRWLDGLSMGGRIVELATGTGWWSPLLAGKGELWCFDAAPAPLERARQRLLAHGLRAHLHVRDAWAEPDGDPAGALFAGFWLSHVERDRTAAFLDLAGRWLAPGGRVAFIDSLPDPQSGAVDHDHVATDDRSLRRLADGREFTVVKVHRTADEVADALRAAGFADVAVTTTGRFFLLATATRPDR